MLFLEYGGLGLDYSYSCALAEELGNINCGAVPMAIGVQSDMATPALARFVTRVTRQVPLVELELLTLPEHLSSPSVFNRVCVTRSLVLYVMFCRSLFVHLSFFFWPLCFLSFFDLWILITPLVSSNSSCIIYLSKSIKEVYP